MARRATSIEGQRRRSSLPKAPSYEGPGLPEVYISKQVAQRMGIRPGNLQSSLTSFGVPEKGPWQPGLPVLDTPNGPIYLAEYIEMIAPVWEERRALREARKRERQ